MRISDLNDLDILECDIKGAYLTAECRKRIYNIAGSKFGSEEGVTMIVKMALYRLKISRAAFRANLARVLHGINYRHTKADPGV